MGQAGHPPDPIRRWQVTVAVPRTVIVPATKPAYEGGAAHLVQGAAATVTGGTAKPWTLALLAPERPFLLKLNDLYLTVDSDGNLSSSETTGTDSGVIFQQLVIGPFPLFACSESCDHRSETNLYPSCLLQLTQELDCAGAMLVSERYQSAGSEDCDRT